MSGAPPPSPTFLHLVDRSRVALQRNQCAHARLLEYHWGAGGYGIRSKQAELPLITGTGMHEPIEEIMKYARDHQGGQGLAPRELVREAIARSQERYLTTVERGGLAGLGDAADKEVQYTAKEQCHLLAATVWGLWRWILPEMLQGFRVLEVEEEEVFVLACTCGLGDGTFGRKEHEGRGCRGVGLMLKPDLIVQRVIDKGIGNVNWKSTGADNWGWRAGLERNPQIALETLGVERRYPQVTFGYVRGLVKGPRDRVKDEVTGRYEGPKRQDSPLCYAYHRAANPPMYQEDWQFTYKYVDDQGQNRNATASKGYVRTAIWEGLAQYEEKGGGGATAAELWMEGLPEKVVEKLYPLVGPLEWQTHLRANLLDGIVRNELRVIEGLRALADPDLEPDQVWAVINEFFPQSWQCVKWGRRCQMDEICQLKLVGDPLESGRFELRRPHHPTELEQMGERGLEPPEWQEQGEEEG